MSDMLTQITYMLQISSVRRTLTAATLQCSHWKSG